MTPPSTDTMMTVKVLSSSFTEIKWTIVRTQTRQEKGTVPKDNNIIHLEISNKKKSIGLNFSLFFVTQHKVKTKVIINAFLLQTHSQQDSLRLKKSTQEKEIKLAAQLL